MKILEKSTTPKGIGIQIEDWKEDYSFMDVCTIAAYPIAKNGSKYQWIKQGEQFRIDISKFRNNDEVRQAFNDLINGAKNIEDFSEQFRNGDKDKYYLGLKDDYIER